VALTAVALLATADVLSAAIRLEPLSGPAITVFGQEPQTPPDQDTDGDGVRDVRDLCPGTARGVNVDETGCEARAGGGLLPWLIGLGAFLVAAFLVARWWLDQPVPEEPELDKDWVVLPVTSAAKDAGIKPAPRQEQPPGQPGQNTYPLQPPGTVNYPGQGYGAPGGYASPPPPPYPQATPPPSQGAGTAATPPPSRPTAPPNVPTVPPSVPAVPPTGAPAQPVGARRQLEAGGEPIPEGEQVDEGQVRFHKPPEGTLQLLPGRLDVVGGDPGRGGIRFVKIPTEDPEVTFGRASGPQYRHIQLKIPTVSRMHARMWFDHGIWSIENLSETNPVVVNGDPMGLGTAGSLSLNDGDRIEMGEVVFRYWI
jgi:hypothetical protein